MQTIWKFPLDITDEQEIALPWGAVPLTVQMQGDQLCLWVRVNPENLPLMRHTIHIYGTGNPIEEEYGDVLERYLGTVQSHGGRFVWHCYWV